MRAAVAAWVMLAALCAAPRVARADKAAAEAAFQQAKDLARQNKWAEACPLFEASYKAEPALGALLNLADCHEHVGKTATAWAEFSDASAQARRANDARADYARQRADALMPALAHLTLHPPLAPIAGMVVRRDDSDVTVLVGTAMPIDPGAHVVTESAPGYGPWTKTVDVAASANVDVDLGDLERAPDTGSGSAAAVPETAAVTVRSQPDAAIVFDGTPAGTGRATATLERGPHTLRVTAPGMRAFQQEVYVAGGDDRTIDVPLDREVVIAPALPVEPAQPRFEAGASVAPGVKLRREDPAVLDYRVQIGVHLGRYATLSLIGQFGSVSASDRCGSDLEGSTPSSGFDFGNRNVFASCKTVAAGLALGVRFARADAAIQPMLEIAPRFGVMLVDYTPTTTTGMASPAISDTWARFSASARAGVDYHARSWPAHATIGAFVDVDVAVAAQEEPNHQAGGPEQFVTILGGLRSTVAF